MPVTPATPAEPVTPVTPAAAYALEEVSAQVVPGELVALVGKNGSGKSTLGRVFNGSVELSTGSVTCDDVRIEASLDAGAEAFFELAARVGYVGQDPEAQLVAARVCEEVAFGPRNTGLDEEAVAARVAASLTAVGLGVLAQARLEDLSLAQQVLVCVAAVLAMEPRYLVLDEVMARLDAAGVVTMQQLLRELRQRGVGVVLITHNLAQAATCDRVLLMEGGHLAWEGAASAFAQDEALVARSGMLTQEELAALAARVAALGHRAPAKKHRDAARTEGLVGAGVACVRGGVTLVEGASGSGKTRLAERLVGLDEDATVTLAGTQVVPGRVGYVAQRAQDELLGSTVREDVGLSLVWQHMPREEAAARVEAALAAVGLNQELWERHPLTLSGGERRRVALAGALAARTEAYVLDDPLAGLDGAGVRDAVALVEHVCGEGAACCVLTSQPGPFAQLHTRYQLNDGAVLQGDSLPGAWRVEGASQDTSPAPTGAHTGGNAGGTVGAAASARASAQQLPQQASQCVPLKAGQPSRPRGLARVDVRVKLATMLAISLALCISQAWLPCVATAVAALLLALASGVTPRALKQALLPVTVLLAVAFTVNSIAPAGEGVTLVALGWGISSAGAARAALFAVRMWALVLVCTAACATSEQEDLTSGFEALARPLARLGVPVADVAMTATLSLAFIPMASQELHRVRAMQRVRGAQLAQPGLVGTLKGWARALVPVLVALFRRAEATSVAMRDRCYGWREREACPQALEPQDKFVLVAGLLVTLVLLSWR
jgi:energy-coupling factor transport system ATP-binding protein